MFLGSVIKIRSVIGVRVSVSVDVHIFRSDILETNDSFQSGIPLNIHREPHATFLLTGLVRLLSGYVVRDNYV